MAQPTYDVAVVGAGIIGAATAYRLRQAGLTVVVVEARSVASGATGNTFSWLNSAGKQPDSYHRLNAAGLAEYAPLQAEIPALEVHRTGSLHSPVDATEDARLEQRRERLQSLGYAARWADRSEVASIEPGLRLSEETRRVLFLEQDAWVHAPQVATTLLQAASATVMESIEVSGIQSDGERVTGLETTAGVISAGAVVVCAGIGAQDLVSRLGVRLPVDRKPGLLLVTAPVLPGTIDRVLYHALDPERAVHIRPDVSGGLRIGSDPLDRHVSEETAADPPPPVASELMARAAAVLPALDGIEVARAYLGIRPVPADGLTVAGKLPGFSNAFAVVTHSGITMGPLLGRLIASEVMGAPPDPLLAEFRPERFAVSD